MDEPASMQHDKISHESSTSSSSEEDCRHAAAVSAPVGDDEDVADALVRRVLARSNTSNSSGNRSSSPEQFESEQRRMRRQSRNLRNRSRNHNRTSSTTSTTSTPIANTTTTNDDDAIRQRSRSINDNVGFSNTNTNSSSSSVTCSSSSSSTRSLPPITTPTTITPPTTASTPMTVETAPPTTAATTISTTSASRESEAASATPMQPSRTKRRPTSMPSLSSVSDYSRLNAAYEREFPLNSQVFGSYLARFQSGQQEALSASANATNSADNTTGVDVSTTTAAPRGLPLANKRLRGLRELFRSKKSTEEQYLADQHALLREYEAVGRERHQSFSQKQKVAVEVLNTGMQALEGLVLEIPSAVWDKIARAQSSSHYYHYRYSHINNGDNPGAEMPPPPKGLPRLHARPQLGQQRQRRSRDSNASGTMSVESKQLASVDVEREGSFLQWFTKRLRAHKAQTHHEKKLEKICEQELAKVVRRTELATTLRAMLGGDQDEGSVSLNQAMSLLVEHNDDVQEAAAVFLNRAEASARTAAMSTSSRNSFQRRSSVSRKNTGTATSQGTVSPAATGVSRGSGSTSISQSGSHGVGGTVVPDRSIGDQGRDDDVCRGRVYVRALPVNLATGNVDVVMILDRNSRPVDGGLQCLVHREGPEAYLHSNYQQLQATNDDGIDTGEVTGNDVDASTKNARDNSSDEIENGNETMEDDDDNGGNDDDDDDDDGDDDDDDDDDADGEDEIDIDIDIDEGTLIQALDDMDNGNDSDSDSDGSDTSNGQIDDLLGALIGSAQNTQVQTTTATTLLPLPPCKCKDPQLFRCKVSDLVAASGVVPLDDNQRRRIAQVYDNNAPHLTYAKFGTDNGDDEFTLVDMGSPPLTPVHDYKTHFERGVLVSVTHKKDGNVLFTAKHADGFGLIESNVPISLYTQVLDGAVNIVHMTLNDMNDNVAVDTAFVAGDPDDGSQRNT